MFDLAFQPQPFQAATKKGACHCDACRGSHQEFDDELGDEEFDEEFVDEEWEAPCPACGRQHETEVAGLSDIVIDPPATPGVHGKPSSHKEPAQVGTKGEFERRCKTIHTCPSLVGLRAIKKIANVPIEYIGFDNSLVWNSTSKRWTVGKRGMDRTINVLPRTGDGLANFLANMKAVGLEVETLLTMGSTVCRCMTYQDDLSNHSSGDAYDFGGLRLVGGGGHDILVANANCDSADRKILHRANACLRLSFARVLDYHDIIPWTNACSKKHPKRHWNHIHCDTNQGKPLNWFTGNSIGWRYVRESLGLKVTGGLDQACKTALKAFAGTDAFASTRKTALALSKLYMREATRP